MGLSIPLEDRRPVVAIVRIALVAVAIRLALLAAPGFPTDVGTFMAWAQRLAAIGPAGFYAPGYFSDYPPGFLYVLWPLGALFDGEVLRLVVKAITIPFDLAIAVLVARLLWRTAGRGAAVLAAGLWLLAPGVIFAGPYWGQVDAVGTLPLLAALLAGGRGRWGLAGALAATAAMVKPQFGLGLVVIVVAVAIEYVRAGAWRPAVRALAASGAVVLALGLPFRAGPLELLRIVRSASETYPFTSLYAFNGWSIVADFWKPDDPYFVIGAVLLVLGLAASCVPLWRRRDVETLLFAGACATLAFYFLPTRAHERYLFPAFALLLPFAATRPRILAPYLVLAAGFVATLAHVFTQYDLIHAPGPFTAVMATRAGQIALAFLMIGSAALIVWRLAHGEARLAADAPAPPIETAWRLPAGLLPGRAPARREYVIALLVALAFLVTRGYRLDQPRDMYFDEVYHARTAFELLAQREPYEWTHPHLAKEIMALGIVAFGDDRIVAHEAGIPGDAVAFAVTNDGVRVGASRAARAIQGRARDGSSGQLRTEDAPRAIAADGDAVWIVTDRALGSYSRSDGSARFRPIGGEEVRALVLTGGRAVVGSTRDTAIYSSVDSDPLVVRVPSIAIAAKPDGSELYLLDPQGTVHVVDPRTGLETRSYAGSGPATAIAYAQGPNRIFVARTDQPALDFIELEGGRRETVPLANGRTGSFGSGATALAVVPRTQFLYALADGRLVVVETHGASPFTAIPTTATRLGVDGTDDTILAAGASGVDVVETGRHALAWRLPGLVLGALLAFFLVLLSGRLFASRRIALFLAAAVLLDGSMFAQARIGMNDVYVGAFLVAAWYFVVAAHAPRRSAAIDLVLAGALFGLALASKWVAVYALVALGLASLELTVRAWERGETARGGPLDLLARRGVNAAFLFAAFALIPAGLYLASYREWFGGPTAPFGWDLVELTKQMYWYHSGLTSPHPAGSPFWSWPFVLKPVYWYYSATEDGGSAVIYDAGNLVLFWGAFVATIWCGAAAVRGRSIQLAFVVFALLAQFVAWIPISRVLFFYHFFTALPYYLLALAVALAVLWERGRRTLVAAYLVLAAAAAVFFYPFVSGQPVPAAESNVFFVLPTWQYACQFYPSFTCPIALAPQLGWGAILVRVAPPALFAVVVAALWASRSRLGALLQRRST